MGAAPTPGTALQAVAHTGPHVYLADGEGGFQVLWRQCQPQLSVSPDPDQPGETDPGTQGDPPALVSLAQNSPNPFNPRTTFHFTVPLTCHVRLAIFDARGRVVRVLVDEQRPAGAYKNEWDGQDAAGRAAPAGLYLARLEAAGRVVSRKIVLAR